MRIILLLVWIAAIDAGNVAAEFPTTRPFEEVRYQLIRQEDPPRQIHVAVVDLSDPDVKVCVLPGGDDPDGAGTFQTVLKPQSAIANREDVDLSINGDFFSVGQQKGPDGKPLRFEGGVMALVIGPAVTDGRVWARSEKPRPSLAIGRNNQATMVDLQDPPPEVQQSVAGSHWIVRHGSNVAPLDGAFAKTTHPRTAVGLSEDAKSLVLVVVDGRRKDMVGMSLGELADLMRSLGCHNAINLDGGGSSQMVLRDPSTGILHIINSPSDGRERAVGNILAVSIRGTKQSEDVQPQKAQTKPEERE